MICAERLSWSDTMKGRADGPWRDQPINICYIVKVDAHDGFVDDGEDCCTAAWTEHKKHVLRRNMKPPIAPISTYWWSMTLIGSIAWLLGLRIYYWIKPSLPDSVRLALRRWWVRRKR